MNRAATTRARSPASTRFRNGNDVHEKNVTPFSLQRQILDVEDVDDHEHGQQDQLRPLRGVAEEQAQLLEHELAPQDAERREQLVPSRPKPPPRAQRSPLSCALLKPIG
jgi:hypothetical protein